MKRLIALMLCVMIPVMAFAADNSYKVTYDGGSLPWEAAKDGAPGIRHNAKPYRPRLFSWSHFAPASTTFRIGCLPLPYPMP